MLMQSTAYEKKERQPNHAQNQPFKLRIPRPKTDICFAHMQVHGPVNTLTGFETFVSEGKSRGARMSVRMAHDRRTEAC